MPCHEVVPGKWVGSQDAFLEVNALSMRLRHWAPAILDLVPHDASAVLLPDIKAASGPPAMDVYLPSDSGGIDMEQIWQGLANVRLEADLQALLDGAQPYGPSGEWFATEAALMEVYEVEAYVRRWGPGCWGGLIHHLHPMLRPGMPTGVWFHRGCIWRPPKRPKQGPRSYLHHH